MRHRSAPQPTAAPAPDPGGDVETYLVYSEGSGRPVNITGNSGIYYDGEGNIYYAIGEGLFCDDYGAYYTTWMPDSAPEKYVIKRYLRNLWEKVQQI